jgi:hypothetical protein
MQLIAVPNLALSDDMTPIPLATGYVTDIGNILGSQGFAAQETAEDDTYFVEGDGARNDLYSLRAVLSHSLGRLQEDLQGVTYTF